MVQIIAAGAIGLIIIFVAGIGTYTHFQAIDKVEAKYTEREHWAMDEVLSKIKPECLKSPR